MRGTISIFKNESADSITQSADISIFKSESADISIFIPRVPVASQGAAGGGLCYSNTFGDRWSTSGAAQAPGDNL